MTIIATKPLYMNDAVLSIAADDYAAACSSITVTPASSVATFKGLKKTAVAKFVSNPDWSLDIVHAQDLETATSLQNYLLEHQGETKTFVFEPLAGGTKVTVSAMIVPGAIGGAGEAVATSTVSLPVNGVPTLT